MVPDRLLKKHSVDAPCAPTEIDPNLSRLYGEASTEDSPEALDAATLDAAREQPAMHQSHARAQGQGRSRRDGRSLRSRWMMPASVIATLVLGVSIALLVGRERPDTADSSAIRQIPSRPQSWPPAPVTESVRPRAADSAAPEAAAAKEAPAAVAPAPPASAQAPAATLPAQVPLPQPALPAPSAAEALSAENSAKANSPSASAPAAATESNAAGESTIGGAGVAVQAAPAAAAKLEPMRQQAIQRSPEAWLVEISRLKGEGRENEAAQLLAEFRWTYPAYAVPETISR
jgi:hypothetical protein